MCLNGRNLQEVVDTVEEYIEFKIKKRILIVIILFLIFVIGISGWYFWSSYHPYINIQVSDGTAGDNLKVEAPYIAYAEKNGVQIASSINLKIYDLTMQHEFMCKSIRESYTSSDIKLKINKKKDKTILKYYGTATSLDGKVEDFNKQITVDYILNADIKYE